MKNDPIVIPKYDMELGVKNEKELKLSECDSLFQSYYNGEASLHALGCPYAVYVSNDMVVYPDGETEQC